MVLIAGWMDCPLESAHLFVKLCLDINRLGCNCHSASLFFPSLTCVFCVLLRTAMYRERRAGERSYLHGCVSRITERFHISLSSTRIEPERTLTGSVFPPCDFDLLISTSHHRDQAKKKKKKLDLERGT